MRIYILPGWQQNSTHWEDVVSLLSGAGHSATAIDIPGFGTEPFIPECTTLEAIADWTQKKIQSMSQHEKFVLIGHSYGGRITAELAARHMSGLAGIILIGSPNLYRPDLSTRARKLLASLLKPISRFVPDTLKEQFRSTDYSAVRGQELQTLFQNIITKDQTDRLSEIAIPTALICGSLDAQAPVRIAHEIHTRIKDSTLDLIDGVGHDVHLEKPQLLAAKINTYVESL